KMSVKMKNGFLYSRKDFPDVKQGNVVFAIAVQSNGQILIQATFGELDGVSGSRVARLLPNGDLDPGFRVEVRLTPVTSLIAQPDGRVLMGGDFSSVNGVSRNRMARVNPDGSLDPSFVPAMEPAST